MIARNVEESIPVRNLSRVFVVAECDSINDQGADSPEHLQHLSSGGSQLDRCDLTAVRWCVRDEDTPGNAFEELGYEEHWKRVAKVHDKDERVQEHEAGNGCPTVSDPASKGTSQHDTADRTKRSTYLESRLPAGFDDSVVGVGGRRAQNTISLPERGQGDKATHNEYTVGFHDLDMKLVTILHREG